MKNSKQFNFLEKSWCDYWAFTIVWPQLFWGRVNDTQDYDAFISEADKYALDLKTSIGFYEDNNLMSIWIIILGFGFSFKRQNGY